MLLHTYFDQICSNFIISSVTTETASETNAAGAEMRSSRSLLRPAVPQVSIPSSVPGMDLLQLGKPTAVSQWVLRWLTARPSTLPVGNDLLWLPAPSVKHLQRGLRFKCYFVVTSEMSTAFSWHSGRTSCLLLSLVLRSFQTDPLSVTVVS